MQKPQQLKNIINFDDLNNNIAKADTSNSISQVHEETWSQQQNMLIRVTDTYCVGDMTNKITLNSNKILILISSAHYILDIVEHM